MGTILIDKPISFSLRSLRVLGDSAVNQAQNILTAETLRARSTRGEFQIRTLLNVQEIGSLFQVLFAGWKPGNPSRFTRHSLIAHLTFLSLIMLMSTPNGQEPRHS